MVFDMGIDMMSINSKADFHKALWNLDREFHLVLILEELDKSMLLLREATVAVDDMPCVHVGTHWFCGVNCSLSHIEKVKI